MTPLFFRLSSYGLDRQRRVPDPDIYRQGSKNLPAMLAQQAGVGILYGRRPESIRDWRREAEKEQVFNPRR